MLKNVIGNLQNNKDSANMSEGNQVTSGSNTKAKTPSSETQGENLMSMMMKMLSGNNKQSSENIESKIFDIYAYKAMDSIVGKIASASKPIDAKYIAQTAFDIAEQMVAERKKRMKNGKGMSDTASESDMKMSIDDEILPKPAQEAIVEM